ncbi:MAG: FG-GAP repeat protein, partial [Chloroflexi bacterium]|nr:FG-GAP repeat protein [Chloroflexota bacterium]
VWSQQAYLKASNTGTLNYFGYAAAINGDTIVVGAYGEDSSAGAAYVFTSTAGVWSQQAYLKASNTGADDNFGWTVAVEGDTLVVGAWGEDSNATGVNHVNQGDNSVSDAGAAYVFTRTAGVWSQQAYLKASNTGVGDFFGRFVAISSNTIVVGAPFEASSATGVNGNQANNSFAGSGAAYVFTRTAGVWSQQAYLKASNTGAADKFGRVVAISGDTIVVGAWEEGSNATGVNGDQTNNLAARAGAAYSFSRTGGVWSQQAYLKASNTGANDFFGWAVAIDGDTVVVGAWGEDSNATGVNDNQMDNSAPNAGAVYIFKGCRRSAQTGAWEDTATWVGGAAPISTDGVCIDDAHTVTMNGDDAIDQLWVYQGGTLDLATHTLAVENGVSNEGTLRQTRTMNGSGVVNFLQIRNSGNTLDQYRGVDIAAGVNLGQTVVEVRGNAAVCNNNDGGAYRNRCFMVNPSNAGTVNITLHTTPSEDDVSDDAFFQYVSGNTWAQGAACADGVGVGGACTGSATFASPAWFLVGSAGNDPTAVTLQQTSTNQANPWLWLVSGLVLLGGTAVGLLRRRVI